MRYFAYENWRARGHITKVHVSDCPFCKGGIGLAGGTRAQNGRWLDLGDFQSVKDAIAVARMSIKDGSIRSCGICTR